MDDCKLYTFYQGEYWNVMFWYTLEIVVTLLLVLSSSAGLQKLGPYLQL